MHGALGGLRWRGGDGSEAPVCGSWQDAERRLDPGLAPSLITYKILRSYDYDYY